MIPIENVYYLLSYAWRDLHHFPLKNRGDESFDSIADVMVHTLAVRMERIIKRGLERSYVKTDEVVPGVKGRLDVTGTLSRLLHVQAKTRCTFDDFHHDIAPNQLLKGVLRKALRIGDLNKGIRDRARAVVLHLREIRDIAPRDADFVRLPARFNNRDYPFTLELARLINRLTLLNETDGRVKFHDFTADDHGMARIFEEFLFGFYNHEHADSRVDRRHIKWFQVHASERDKQFLPIMRTDAVLETEGRILIVDAKYYREALKGWHGTERVRSSNLYQILSYVQNLKPQVDKHVEGMLVYPVVGSRFSFDYSLDGRVIKVRSIDLNQAWRDIHRDLLLLVA